MDLSEAFPSNYLQASDLKDRNVTLTIARYETTEIGREKKTRPVLYFQGAKKGLILNKTNARTIANAYGTNLDKWTGRQIILYPRMVEFEGDDVKAIRVRIPQVMAPAPAPVKQATAPAPVVAEPVYDELNPPPHDVIGGGDMDDEIPFAPEWR